MGYGEHMKTFQWITSNYIINVGAVAWGLAQLIKTLLTLLTTKKLVLERLVGAGGMPSSHSALTTSIAFAMWRKVGFDSPLFGLALCFAAVVMYDAMGVRRAAGEQAKVLNRMVFEFHFPSFQKLTGQGEKNKEQTQPAVSQLKKETMPLLDKEFKENLGHTPLEVCGGILLGVLVAAFMPVI